MVLKTVKCKVPGRKFISLRLQKVLGIVCSKIPYSSQCCMYVTNAALLLPSWNEEMFANFVSILNHALQ